MHTKLIMEHQKTQTIISELKEEMKQSLERPLFEYFKVDSKRVETMSVSAPYIFADFSKNLLSSKTFKKLCQIPLALQIEEKIKNMFGGGNVNTTEIRPALHTLLRRIETPTSPSLAKKHAVCMKTLQQMESITREIYEGKRKSAFGERITDVVSIGIGGSHLGSKLILDALRKKTNQLDIHFLENADQNEIARVLHALEPRNTLFLVASKSFSTGETLLNAIEAKKWLSQSHPCPEELNKSFIGITNNSSAANAFGISTENILPLWEWVGGRFSVWSAIGLPIALGHGMTTFYDFLAGAREMDDHFLNSTVNSNLPIILALLSFWNHNCLGAESYAVVPYCDNLRFFPSYLQQLEMESNGKSITLDGNEVSYNTAPTTWGGVGTASQHAFFQLIHQGTRMIPVDFILPLQTGSFNEELEHYRVANCLAQSETLMLGNREKNIKPEKRLAGSRPSTTLMLENLSPRALGALLSLYEHKTETLGFLWNINSFDQWGVENGKKAASRIMQGLNSKDYSGHDQSTSSLMRKYVEKMANDEKE